MREIRFRAWDKANDDMIFGNELQLSLNGLNLWVLDQIYKDEFTLGNISDYELMQYTGLKDKNGIEVYEGDIVKCTRGCPHEVIFKLEHGGNVMGGMPTFYLSGLNEGYQWMGYEEVIGNIYDNPDLLETKKSS